MIKIVIHKIYFILGIVALLLAIIGVVLPLLPTTPFILLAIYFFDKSSERFHRWCMKLPGVKEAVNDWNSHGVIRRKAKIQAIGLIAISAVIIILYQLPLYLKIITLLILSLIVLFIQTRPSEPKQQIKNNNKEI